MSGVHPETLRAWERRYEVIQPRRDERGRRVYAPEDVERLRLLRRATELGHPISRLACLGPDELRRVSDESPAGQPRDTADLNRLVALILDAVQRYRVDECDEVLGLAATLLAPERLVRQVVMPAMTLVGESWHRGEMSIGQERLLSCSARRTLSSLIATYRRRATGPVLVLATLPGEPHEIGLMVTALLAAIEGVDCIYLGPEIPAEDLITAADATAARCVGLSFVTAVPEHGQLVELCARLPRRCELWLGGAATTGLCAKSLPAGCVRVAGDEALREHSRRLCAS
jgi:methanogenic corrinoid protein MtbC1